MSDEATERIAILLQARDKDFQRAMDRSNKLIAKFERQAGQSMSRSARTVDRNLKSIGRSVQVLAGTVLGSVLVRAVDAAISRTAAAVKSVAAIGDEAKRSGLGVDEFQQLAFVAEQSRIPIDALIDGMKELNLRADEFVVTGQGPAAESFRRLGLGAATLKQKLDDPSELLLDIIDRMEDLDRAAQIRVADEVFGGTAGERFVELLEQGDEGVRALMQRARELGIVLDRETIEKAAELDRKFAEVQKRVSTLAKTIVVNLAGAIDEALTIDVDDIFGSAERAISMLGEENYRALKDTPQVLKAQETNVRDLQDAYEELFRLVNEATGPTGFRLMDVADIDAAHELAAILSDIDGEMQALRKGKTSAGEFEVALSDLVDEALLVIENLNDIDAQRMSGVIGQVQALAGALASVAQKASEARANLPAGDTETVSMQSGPSRRFNNRPPSTLAPKSSPRPRLPSVDFGTAPGGGRGGSMASYQREVEATREAIARLEAEAASMLMAAQYGTELGDSMEYARKRAELLYAAQREGRAITPELTAEVDALALAYVEAGMSADDMETRMERLRDSAERGADALSDVFLSVLDGSKDAKDAVASLLMEIAKAQIMSGFKGLAGSGGFLGALGGLLFPSAAGNVFEGGRAVPFARGGVVDGPSLFPMSDGRTGLMGEAGPEAIMPLERGADGKLGVRAKGGGSQAAGPVTLNFQPVIDARGADQAAVARLEGAMARLHAEFGGRVQKELRHGSNRRVNRAWSGS